jgi:lysyl-tRNA synthetase class 2
MISAIRAYLDGVGMLEVETPILQPIYGGAAARPFTTFHNELKQQLYLRISFELYLKRLIVGGYDAVYEIGRDFRNEGVSFKHNPEFTMLEFYKAYIDYRDVMVIAENMVAHAAQAVNGSLSCTFDGHVIDLTTPWRRVTMRDIVREYAGIDYMQYPTAELLGAEMRARGMSFKPDLPWGKLIEHLFSEYAEPKLIQPTIVHDYPRDISPFAKRVAGDDLHVERFEFYIGGMELGNAFSELNDPLDQEQRFLEMAETFKAGDDDETPLDEDFLRAMRYGMPPMGGFGMGIDRLAILLTNQSSIRDVLLFPHMRDEQP